MGDRWRRGKLQSHAPTDRCTRTEHRKDRVLLHIALTSDEGLELRFQSLRSSCASASASASAEHSFDFSHTHTPLSHYQLQAATLPSHADVGRGSEEHLGGCTGSSSTPLRSKVLFRLGSGSGSGSGRRMWPLHSLLALLLATLVLTSSTHAADRHAHHRTNHSDLGPVIGAGDHDYRSHSSSHSAPRSKHSHSHAVESANDDDILHIHHRKPQQSDSSPDASMSSPTVRQPAAGQSPPAYGHGAQQYYPEDKQSSDSAATSSDKLNKYDQAIAQAQSKAKHAEASDDNSASPASGPPPAADPYLKRSSAPKQTSAPHKSESHTPDSRSKPEQRAAPKEDHSILKPISKDSDSTHEKATAAPTEAPTTNAPATTPPPPPTETPTSPPPPYAMSLTTVGHTIYLDEQPYYIRGVHYSPSPIGMTTAMYPYGDWELSSYRAFWDRDFPLVKDLGANTLFISDWRTEADHGYFLDVCKEYDLKVIANFPVNGPVGAEWQRQGILGAFTAQVQKYARHPALLGWSFGKELNAPWSPNMLQQLNEAFGCGWFGADYTQNHDGCRNNPNLKSEGYACSEQTECVYRRLMEFVNTAAIYSKNALSGTTEAESYPHLIFTSLSDTDLLPLRLEHYEKYAPLVDVWGLQSYRGKTFGQRNESLLWQYAEASGKPLLVTDYGIDAYNDPCGYSNESPCYNSLDKEKSAYGEDEDLQAEWLGQLTSELWNDRSTQYHANLHAHKKAAKKHSAHGSSNSSSMSKHDYDPTHRTRIAHTPVAGAIVNAYVDEYWRALQPGVVRGCYGPIPYGHPGFDKSMCEWKAHVTCPAKDAGLHHLCGYQVGGSTFDGYANVAWFGITKPLSVGAGKLDLIQPRLAFRRIQDHWATNQGMRWLLVSIITLAIASGITAYVWKKWEARKIELVALTKEVTDSIRAGGGRDDDEGEDETVPLRSQ